MNYHVNEATLSATIGDKDPFMDQYGYVDALGPLTTINAFRLRNESRNMISYRDQDDREAFQIQLRWARVSFDMTIDPTNPYYPRHRLNPQAYPNGDMTKPINNQINQPNGYRILGITVGDLIKHYYYTHQERPILLSKDPVEVIDLDEDIVDDLPFPFMDEPTFGPKAETEPAYNDKLNQRIWDLIKRSPLVDTHGTEPNRALGLFDHKNQRFSYWDPADFKGGLKPIKDIGSFEAFCRQVLYFAGGHIKNLVQILNNLTSTGLMAYLFKYFLYNEPSEVYTQSEGRYGMRIYRFRTPKSIPAILRYFYEAEPNEKVLKAYQRLMKPLNHRQEADLNQRYKPYVFTSLKAVPEEYPYYALRHVWIKEWSVDGLYGGDHKEILERFREGKGNQKIKYLSAKRGKPLPKGEKDRIREGHHHWNLQGQVKSRKNLAQQRANGIKSMIDEAIQVLRDEDEDNQARIIERSDDDDFVVIN